MRNPNIPLTTNFSGENPTDPNFKFDKKKVDMEKVEAYQELDKAYAEKEDEKSKDGALDALNNYYDTLNPHEKYYLLKNV